MFRVKNTFREKNGYKDKGEMGQGYIYIYICTYITPPYLWRFGDFVGCNRLKECNSVFLSLIINLFDEDGIRTHAGRAQWISSPSP